MLVKFTIRPGPDAKDKLQAIQRAMFAAGGLVKAAGDDCLVHYTEHGEIAQQVWESWGYEMVSCEGVTLGPEGLAGLLADLTKEGEHEE